MGTAVDRQNRMSGVTMTGVERDVANLPGMELLVGLPESYRPQLAAVFYEAFAAKLRPVVPSRARCQAILEQDLNGRQAIGAVAGDQLLGFAGLTQPGAPFCNFRLSTCTRVSGRLVGLIQLLLFRLFLTSARPGEVALDALAVRRDRRGQGIGSRLLRATLDYARERGARRVVLQVVDTNDGARRLYERFGFVPTGRHRYPLAAPFAGFSATITMVRALG